MRTLSWLGALMACPDCGIRLWQGRYACHGLDVHDWGGELALRRAREFADWLTT